MDTLDKTGTTDATQDSEDFGGEIITREEQEVFNDYITSVSTALLDIESQDYFHKFIHTEENLNLIQSFITDKQNRSLIVSKVEEFVKPVKEKEDEDENKEETKEVVETNESENKSMVTITLDLKVTYRGGDSQSIAFIKRHNSSLIDVKKGRKQIGKQLQIFNLGYVGDEIDLFRLANIYVDNGLIPLFASYKSKKASDDTNNDHLDEIEQLLAKLRLEFTHCTQDQISIEVKLAVPKKILEKRDIAIEEGRLISEEDFDTEVSNSSFFDSLK